MTDLQISTTRKQARPFRISARTRNVRIIYYPGAPDLAFVKDVMFHHLTDLSALAWQQSYTGRIRMTAHDALNCTDCIGMEIQESITLERGSQNNLADSWSYESWHVGHK